MIKEEDINFDVKLNELCIRYMYISNALYKIIEDESINQDSKLVIVDNLKKELDFLRENFSKIK